ncbi:MAG: SH3 domain-containing protein [Phenylobacterium sp.]|uniref:SH3 domain-containing protein n=1 Tax=Phenylobacterium sp. TaxID=1871053 RepID=UPI0025CC2487|nr:SH3 domain-containing protein [Phenylobacterium sp.]MBI1198922.1 SH3 domain-containing protein [Phenylobacterium sp.]
MPRTSRKTVLALGASAALAVPAASPSVAAAEGLGGLFSCSAPGSSDTTGAVVGGLVGALAGSQVSKHDRALGAAIGAGIGAAIGNSIGCRMDKKSRLDAQTAFQRALDTGKAQTWRDPETGASGRVEVLGPSYGSAPPPRSGYSGRWRFADGVTPAFRVNDAGGAYAANGRINMRSGPSTSYAVVDRLRSGEQVEVAGEVAGGWLAVVEDGLIQGYVSRSVMSPVGGGGRDGDCRLVEHTLNEPGRSAVRERYNACRGADGRWDIERA